MIEIWTWRPLGELFEIGAGKTMSAAARNGVDKTPFLRTSNVLWDEIDLESVDQMSIPEHELPDKLLSRGDLLVCEGGEIGRAAIWNGEVKTMSFQNHLHRLRPVVEEVEPRFYVYFLQSAFTQLGIFEGTGNKTTIPNLSRSRLAALRVPQPMLDEQQAIVAVLARVRDAIKTHEQSIALALDLKRVAMRSLFTRGLRGEVQKETEIGPVPVNWKVKPLSDCAYKPDYGYTASASNKPIGPRLLRITDIKDGSVDWDAVPYCNCNKEIIVSKGLNEHDIVVARIGATTGKSFLIDNCPEAVFASYLIRIRADRNKIYPDYLHHYMQTTMYWQHIAHNKGGRLKGGINIPILASIPLPIPLLSEQREIATVLNTIDRKVDLHRRKRKVLDDLFKVLLHKLMTGEIRVTEFDISVHSTSMQPNLNEGIRQLIERG